MTMPEETDIRIPRFDREVMEILANLPNGLKLSNDLIPKDGQPAFISAAGGFSEHTGQFSGWITYDLFGRKIRFQTTRFTTRKGSFFGSGGFLNLAIPLARLDGKTGTFSMSGANEAGALVLKLGDEFVCVPLILVGQGPGGFYADGELIFRAVD